MWTTVREPPGFEGTEARAKLEELRLWQQALKGYRAQNRDQAKPVLFNLQRRASRDELYGVGWRDHVRDDVGMGAEARR